MHHDIILLDGPTGTELQRRGVDTTLPLWSAGANRTAPEILVQVHREYIEAGADLITANTFRTNTRAVVNSGLTRNDARDLTRRGVELARRAIELSGRDSVLLAGSDAPAEDCYSPALVPDDQTLRAEHREHIEWMMEDGCDLILIETMNTLREAIIATEAGIALGARVWTSLVPDETGERLLSGEGMDEAVEAIAALGSEAILVNCASTGASLRAVEVMARYQRVHGGEWHYGAYPNGGIPDPIEGWSHAHSITSETFVDALSGMIAHGATVVGGCCCTTPEQLALMGAALHRMSR